MGTIELSHDIWIIRPTLTHSHVVRPITYQLALNNFVIWACHEMKGILIIGAAPPSCGASLHYCDSHTYSLPNLFHQLRQCSRASGFAAQRRLQIRMKSSIYCNCKLSWGHIQTSGVISQNYYAWLLVGAKVQTFSVQICSFQFPVALSSHSYGTYIQQNRPKT